MGISAALIFPTTLSIISNTFTDRPERASALWLWGASVGVGVTLAFFGLFGFMFLIRQYFQFVQD